MKIKTRKLTVNEQRKLIKESYNYVSIIDNPHNIILNNVVLKKYFGIYLIKDPSEDLQFMSVRKRSKSISCIEKPTKDVQLECVKKYPELIFYIENPCQEAIDASVIYNLNLNEDSIIKYIKLKPENARFFRSLTEKIEDFIISECQEAIRWLTKPSKKIQLFAMDKRLTDYLDRYQLCKEALDLFKDKYVLADNMYVCDCRTVRAFLSQHNLDLSVKELYFILKKYNTGLKPYLSYEIVDKLLEIDSSDTDDYNIKDYSLLEKYSSSRKCLAVI